MFYFKHDLVYCCCPDSEAIILGLWALRATCMSTPLMNTSAEKMQDAQIRNIPQARVSPTVSETSRRPFPCQSEVFAHCPLSSWLLRDTNMSWTFEPSLLWILELNNSVRYFSAMIHQVVLDRLREVCIAINHNTGSFQVRKQNKTNTVRRRTDLINPQCFRMNEKSFRNIATSQAK